MAPHISHRRPSVAPTVRIHCGASILVVTHLHWIAHDLYRIRFVNASEIKENEFHSADGKRYFIRFVWGFDANRACERVRILLIVSPMNFSVFFVFGWYFSRYDNLICVNLNMFDDLRYRDIRRPTEPFYSYVIYAFQRESRNTIAMIRRWGFLVLIMLLITFRFRYILQIKWHRKLLSMTDKTKDIFIYVVWLSACLWSEAFIYLFKIYAYYLRKVVE